MTPSSTNVATVQEAADRFLDLACLSYDGRDAVARREQAAVLLAAWPDIVTTSVAAAAAVGDVAALAAQLQAAPASATARSGPRDWPPLLYLCYGRVNPPAGDAVAAARLLLANGADSNSATRITDCRFSAITGAVGEGEGGVVAQPPHPQARALVTVLLDAGADPNDGQAMYNTHFRPDDSWLELFTSRGLTAAMRANWDETSQVTTLDFLLGRAAEQGFTARVQRLLSLGGSPNGRNVYNKRPHLENALRQGHAEIARLLREHGAAGLASSPAEQLHITVLAGDEAGARTLLAAHPGLVVPPAALLAAAEQGHLPAVQLALALGVPVGARDHEGLTALHRAGRQGHVAVVEALIAAGAPFSVRDPVYGGTPIGHAAHFTATNPTPNRAQALALLRERTTDPFDLYNRFDEEGRTRLATLAAADPAVAGTQAQLLLLSRAYAAFNERDLEGALALMHADVDWPNGMEGGWVQGREAVRAYWTRQWQSLDPNVTPTYFGPAPGGRIAVEVHQVARDRAGALLADQQVRHVYEITAGLIRRMDIQSG
jgi:ankyrin repeat protein